MISKLLERRSHRARPGLGAECNEDAYVNNRQPFEQAANYNSVMRTRWLVLLAVVLLPLAAASQDSGPSFVVQLKHTKIDLPYSSSSSCLTVFSDGRFHMGRCPIGPGQRLGYLKIYFQAKA